MKNITSGMYVLKAPMNISSVVLKTTLIVLLGTMSKPVVLPFLMQLPSNYCFIIVGHEGTDCLKPLGWGEEKGNSETRKQFGIMKR